MGMTFREKCAANFFEHVLGDENQMHGNCTQQNLGVNTRVCQSSDKNAAIEEYPHEIAFRISSSVSYRAARASGPFRTCDFFSQRASSQRRTRFATSISCGT